jgi:ketosteroid isomerase-like protein
MAQTPEIEDTVEAEIRKIDHEEATAVLTTDLSTLEKFWWDDFTVNGPNNQIVKGKTNILELVKSGVIDYTSFEREHEAVLLYSNTAILMGLETVEPKGNSPFAGHTLRRRFTNIWMKQNDRWQLIARQATIISRD